MLRKQGLKSLPILCLLASVLSVAHPLTATGQHGCIGIVSVVGWMIACERSLYITKTKE
ncbi:hypothetical protein [Nostoc commune]|uniref:hypothetical protein n=1 Tax=Nostoc commune TaxID=1178 RepID=UPI0018C84436|nr:hypothetical protein [Nostoc commune]